MSANTTDNDTDHLQALVRGLAEAMYNDPGEKPVPMATTDEVEVIRAQLTENTGTHFLDSGSSMGRHWEENEENPPWEDAAWDVYGYSNDPHDGYVTHNVYHFMERTFKRDEAAVALEAGLYAYGRGPGEGEAWLTCMEDFANGLLDGEFTEFDLREWGVPDEWVGQILGVANDARQDAEPSVTSRRDGRKPIFTANTYNHEGHGLSQVLQGTNLGGPYAEYTFLQVHQGADVRGGYTGPRVYRTFDGWFPTELWFSCDNCGWNQSEMGAFGSEDLIYLSDADLDADQLVEAGWLEDEQAAAEHPALVDARDADHIDGAVFHRCGDEPGEFGYVRF